jgi:hypothetical protein
MLFASGLPDDPLGALIIVAATAAVVSASTSRQENLSGRMRSLTAEFRRLVQHKPLGRVDSARLDSLADQIPMFEARLHHCIKGHIALYSTLLLEVLAYGYIFFLRGLQDAKWFLFSVICLGAAIGVGFHLLEYCSSHKTTSLETRDITAYIFERKNPETLEPKPHHKLAPTDSPSPPEQD